MGRVCGMPIEYEFTTDVERHTGLATSVDFIIPFCKILASIVCIYDGIWRRLTQ